MLWAILFAGSSVIGQTGNRQLASQAGTLLVWEGSAGGNDYSGAFIRDYLETAGFTVDYRTSFPVTLTGYDAIFLSYGNSGANGSAKTEFTDVQASLVRTYLESGGKVYLEGGDAFGNDQSGNNILYGLFGLGNATDGFTHAISSLSGQSGTITQGMSFSSSGQSNNDFIDRYTVFGGSKAFVESGYGTVAVQYSGIYGQKTFAFSYALAELNDSGGSSRQNILGNLVNFFELNSALPDISVSPASIDISMFPGTTDQRTLNISNVGGGTLNWDISSQDTQTVRLQLPGGESIPVSVQRSLPKVAGTPSPLLRSENPSLSQPPAKGDPINDNVFFSSTNSVSLIIDDGGRENAIGLNNGGQFIWMNQFSPHPGEFPFTLEEVWVMFGSDLGVTTGDLVDIFVYEDTDGNIDNGATLLASHTNAAVQAVDDQTFSVYGISPVVLSGPGDVIIAVVNRTAGILEGDLPAALDEGNNAGRSWIGTYSGNPSGSPAVPATAAWGTTSSFGFPGNWMIRGRGFRENNCDWMSQAPFSGLITSGSSENVTVTFDATGLSNGIYQCQLVVASNDPDEPLVVIPVTLTVINRAPVITAIANQQTTENTPLQVNIQSSDVEGHNIALSVNNMPTFGSLTDNGDGSGHITFSPGFLDAGSYAGIRVIATDDGVPVAMDSVAFALTVDDLNRVPVLPAIAAQSVDEADTLTLLLTASDPDTDNALAFSATNLPAFGTLTDNGDGSANLQFLPGYDAFGTYPNIQITVTDDAANPLFASRTFSLSVADVNRAPAVSAIAPQSVNEGATLSVPVSGSDPDGNGISFSTLNLPAFGALTDNGNGTGNIQLSPGFEDAASYTINVIATDNGTPNLSDTLSFVLTVNVTNRAPVWSAVSAQSVDENSSLSVPVSASDPDGNGVSLTVLSAPAFTGFTDNGGGSGSVSFTPGLDDAGIYTVQLIATDNGTPNLTDTLSFSLTVNNVNRAPVFAAVSAQSMTENSSLSVPISASDADGNGLTFSGLNLPGFASVTNNGDGTGNVQLTPGFEDGGSYTLSAIVTDDGTPNLSDTVSFSLTISEVNRAPVWSVISAQSVDENSSLSVLVSANDPDGNGVSLTVLSAPAFTGFTDNGGGSGSVSFTPGLDDAGNYTVQLIATDNGSPNLTDTLSFSLTVNNVNRAPVFAAVSAQSMTENSSLSVPISATDADGNGLTFSGLNLPGFASVTNNGDGTGNVQLTPGFEDGGSYTLSAIVTDDGTPNLSDTVSFSLTISEVNRAPVWSVISAQSVDENSSLSVPVSASDPDGNGVSLTVFSAPAFTGFTDNGSGSGSVSFTPGLDDAGNYTIQLIATDNGTPNLTDTLSFSLTVNNVNRAPVFAAVSAQSMTENSSLSVPISASDADGNGLTFSGLNLPGFASVTNNGDGTGNVQLTPGFEDGGSYTLSAIVTDDGTPNLSDTVSFSLTISEVNRAPVWSVISAQSVDENSSLSVPVSASDPDGNGMSITVLSAPVFASLTDNGNGSGSIAFSPDAEDAGNYTVELIVTDNGSPALRDTVAFSLTVNNVNRAPIWSTVSAQTMNENSSLSVPVSASDPDGNGISLSALSIPAFANLTDNGNGSGSIAFTTGFEDAGNYTIELIATDNGTPNLRDTLSFSLTISEVNRAPIWSVISAQSVNEGSSLSVPVAASDPDGNGMSISVLSAPAFASLTDNGNGSGSIAFSPDAEDAGNYTVELIVTDNGSPALRDTVAFSLTVNNVNRAPIWSSVSAQSMNENSSLSVPVSASDPDGNGISLSALSIPAFANLTDNGNGSGSIAFTTGFENAGNYTIELIATDNGTPNLRDTLTFALTVNNVNRAPVFAATAAQSVNENSSLSVPVSASDPDGNGIAFSALSLPGFASLSDNGNGSASVQISPGFEDAGNYTLSLIATDNGSPNLSDTLSFVLTVGNVNRAPVFAATAAQSMNENSSLSAPVSASDPDGNGMSFAGLNLPAFATLTDNGDGTGSIAFTTGYDDAGSYTIRAIVTDNGTPNLSDTLSFSLAVSNVNRAPVFAAIANQTISENSGLTLPVSATDPDGNGMTIFAQTVPAFGTFSDNGNGTASLQFAPGFDDAGSYPVVLLVLDNGTPALSDTLNFTLTVTNLNRTPVLAAIANQSMEEGAVLNLPVSATDPDGNAISLSAQGIPTFGSFSDNGGGTGSLQFSPGFGSAGNFNIKIFATDNGSPALTDTVSFTLSVGNVNRAPEIAAIANSAVNEGGSLAIPVSANDPDDDGLTLTAIGLPAFASFTDNGDGSGSFQFNPDFSHAGVYNLKLAAVDNGVPALSDTASFTITINNINRAPVLAAVANQGVNEGGNLAVPVSASDPDGDALVLTAPNLPAFGSFTDNGDGTGNIEFTPGFGDEGSYTIQLVSIDNGTPVLSDTISFALVVGNVNRAPVLTAIANRSMNENGALSVAVSASDPDGNGIVLAAQNLPSFGTFTDNGDGTGNFQFNPDFTNAGSYSIQIIAVDNGVPALSDTTGFVLTVNDVNRAPQMVAIANQAMDEGASLSVPVSASDPDGDGLALSALNVPAFAQFTDNGNGTGNIQLTPGFETAGNYTLSIRVLDNGTPVLSDTVTFSLSVSNVNRAPVVTAISNRQVDEGATIAFPVSANDPDGNAMALSVLNLPDFGSFTDNGNGTGSFEFSPEFGSSGNYNIKVVALDNGTPALSDTAGFVLTVGNVNRAPELTDIADQSMPEGNILNLPVTATDPDGDGVILSAANLPAFATFTDNGGGTGNLRLAPDFSASGSYPIRLIARDTGIPQLSDTLNFVLTVTNTNRAPEISAIANQTIREGLVLNVPVSAVDPDGNLVVLSAQNVPAFGTFTDNGGGSGNFRFTPGFGDGGSFTISAIARDTGTPQLTDTLSFVLTVVDTNRAPVIVTIANRAMNESDTLIFDISASDPDGDSLAFSVDGLPAFGTLSDSGDGTGSLHFLPGFSDAGIFSIDVKVTDNGSPTVTTVENFVLTVQNINRSPMLSAIPDTSLSEGDTLLLAVTASDPDGDPINFSTANLPVFTEFTNISNGSASLKVAPGFRDSGSYPGIEITASDTGAAAFSVSIIFRIDVADSNTVPVATDDNFITKEDSAATFLPLANDSDANGDTLRIVAILSPSAGGTIAVLPGDTAVFFEPAADFDGTFGFDYVIGDGQGVTDTATVSIAVTPVNDAPLLTGLPDSLVFNGDALDTLRIWDAISDVDDSLSAMNITWQALPDTLAFSWLADSGWLQVGAKQPNASVTAELVVTVSDAAGASVADTIGVRIIGVMGIGDDDGNIPLKFVVYQNYPNPFNPQTTIRFGIPVAEKVKISVYNILGQQVAVLLNEQLQAGYHTVQFDARQIASGMYFYLVQTEKNRSVHKMMLIK